MQTILIMCAGIAVGKLLFPRRWAVGNGALQTVLTILLIFTMGVSIGRNENLLQNLGSIGLASVAFCLLSMAGSVAVVYLSTRRIFPRQAGPGAAGRSVPRGPPGGSALRFAAAPLAAGRTLPPECG